MKTISIISQKGGAGKTTVAVHLAVTAEQRGLRTAIFDLDPQASAASWSDKRKNSSPTVVSAQAARLPNLLEQAVGQSADLPEPSGSDARPGEREFQLLFAGLTSGYDSCILAEGSPNSGVTVAGFPESASFR